jgi:small-conductance mechanosensitive channel
VDGVDGILTDPQPVVLFNGFGDSSLDFEVRAWTDQFDRFMSIRSDLCVAIERVLGEADIVIPFPQRDLHVKSVDAEAFRADRHTGEGGAEGATPLRPTGPDPRG